MSNKEKAIQLLENIPESKMIFVINVLENLKELMIEEVEPDEWDKAMIAEAERENDGTTVSLDELLKKEGLTYADLRD